MYNLACRKYLCTLQTILIVFCLVFNLTCFCETLSTFVTDSPQNGCSPSLSPPASFSFCCFTAWSEEGWHLLQKRLRGSPDTGITEHLNWPTGAEKTWTWAYSSGTVYILNRLQQTSKGHVYHRWQSPKLLCAQQLGDGALWMWFAFLSEMLPSSL